MNGQQNGKRSLLFTVRVWVEEVDDGRPEIRGRVVHVLTGESTHFREWPALLAFVERWLDVENPQEHSKEGGL